MYAKAVGVGHALLVKNGVLWAKGWNSKGELGVDTCVDSPDRWVRPKLSGIVGVAVGENHSLAVDSSGQVWAWGSNHFGQLGRRRSEWDQPRPTQVRDLPHIVAVSAWGCSSAALAADGGVWTWGNNLFRKLGDGGCENRHEPMRVRIPAAMAVSVGSAHMLALDKRGKVWVWGRGHHAGAQAGVPLWTPPKKPVFLPFLVSEIPKAVAICAWEESSFALTESGDVWAWGRNDHGELLSDRQDICVGVPFIVPGLSWERVLDENSRPTF